MPKLEKVVDFLDKRTALVKPLQSANQQTSPSNFFQLDVEKLQGSATLDLDEKQISGLVGYQMPSEIYTQEFARRHPAWYSPITYYGMDGGIYFEQQSLLDRASAVANLLTSKRGSNATRTELFQIGLQVAFGATYLHELYHHKVESCAIRLTSNSVSAQNSSQILELVEFVSTVENVGNPQAYDGLVKLIHRLKNAPNSPIYHEFKQRVGNVVKGSDDHLEEALANAYSLMQLKRMVLQTRGLNLMEQDAIYAFYLSLYRSGSAGYRRCVDYLSTNTFRAGECMLRQQMVELSPTPKDNGEFLQHSSRLMEPLLSKANQHVYLVVHPNDQPILPTL